MVTERTDKINNYIKHTDKLCKYGLARVSEFVKTLSSLHKTFVLLLPVMKKSIRKNNKKFIEPSPEIFQSLIYLYSNGDLQGTLNKAKTLLKEYPDSPTLYNICGITYSDLDKHEEALDIFTWHYR